MTYPSWFSPLIGDNKLNSKYYGTPLTNDPKLDNGDHIIEWLNDKAM